MGSGARAAGHGRPRRARRRATSSTFLKSAMRRARRRALKRPDALTAGRTLPPFPRELFPGPPAAGALPRERRHPRTRAQGAQRRGPFFDHARFFLAAALLPIVLGGGTGRPSGPGQFREAGKTMPGTLSWPPGQPAASGPPPSRRRGGAGLCNIFVPPYGSGRPHVKKIKRPFCLNQNKKQ